MNDSVVGNEHSVLTAAAVLGSDLLLLISRYPQYKIGHALATRE
jgi:hypothetical protein